MIMIFLRFRPWEIFTKWADNGGLPDSRVIMEKFSCLSGGFS
jgi:hypothetical protein